MELCILRKETLGTSGFIQHTDSETLSRFEVIDGSPKVGDIIPIRFHLSSVALTPSYRNVNNRFSVRYFINVIMYDEEDRKFFK